MAEQKKVKIYSTPSCVYCKMAKEFFAQSNVEFEDVNVGVDQEAAQDMIKKSGQMGVPVIEINGQMVIGFDKERIMELLNLKK
ncbi:MAG: Glutaredoxin-like protein, YruB-family [Parcubacteria group bacterium GW2011_GWA2_39_18]|nr:MAG: Glutaredoxin-like protein, YruB-family [Parcubacteria group bacterium GW2011_GWA2_39_18]